MATVNPSIVSAHNVGAQKFYSVDQTTTIPAVPVSTVSVANTAGGFNSASFNAFNRGDTVTVSGTLTGNATISGYSDPTTYYITSTDGSTAFVLSDTAGGSNITTTAGTTTGLTFVASGGAFPAVQGAEYYVSAGSAVPLTFNTVDTTVGTDIVLDNATGNITLQPDITYEITVTSDVSTAGGVQAGSYHLIVADPDLSSHTDAIGATAPFGQTLVVTVTPVVETVYNVVAVNNTGTDWTAPGQIVNAAITIAAVSGFNQ